MDVSEVREMAENMCVPPDTITAVAPADGQVQPPVRLLGRLHEFASAKLYLNAQYEAIELLLNVDNARHLWVNPDADDRLEMGWHDGRNVRRDQ